MPWRDWRVAGSARMRARLALSALATILIVAVVFPREPTKGWLGDVEFYQAVEAGLRDGQPYYEVAGSELRQRGYPTLSPFNWRAPLLLWFLSVTPPYTGRVLLLMLAFAAVLATIVSLSSLPVWAQAVGIGLQLGALSVAAAPTAPYFSEPWVGLLILLSAACYVRMRWIAGAVLGIVAVLIRELAAPYCLICGLLAFANRRWTEAATWTAGGAACVAYYGWHFMQVRSHGMPGDVAHHSSWIQGGGISFLLNTVGVNQWCLLWPSVSAAAICTLVVASLWSRAVPQIRLPAVVYIGFFACVGLPFNDYWGMVTSPLWALAAGFGLHATRRLLAVGFSI